MNGGVYTRSVGGSLVFVTVYIDDLIIAETHKNIELVLSELQAEFKSKDLGPVKAYGDFLCSWSCYVHITKWLHRQNSETLRNERL